MCSWRVLRGFVEGLGPCRRLYFAMKSELSLCFKHALLSVIEILLIAQWSDSSSDDVNEDSYCTFDSSFYSEPSSRCCATLLLILASSLVILS